MTDKLILRTSTKKKQLSERRIQNFPEKDANPKREGGGTYYLAKISRKLHENEENCTGGGGGGRRPKFYYVDPPLFSHVNTFKLKCMCNIYLILKFNPFNL